MPTAAGAGAAAAAFAMQSAFTIEPFDRHKMKWSRWVERLEGAFVLFGTGEQAKLPMLLHFMGGETYDVVSDKLAPVKPQTKNYDEIVQLLEQHFNPEPLEILENFRFWCRRQGDVRAEESIDDYLISLRKLAITCNFGNYLNTALRNQFVFGLKDHTMRARLLEVKNLTLDQARNIAISLEQSVKGGQEIQSRIYKPEANLLERPTAKYAKSKVNKTGNAANKVSNNKRACYRCGSTAHFANKCSHTKTVCNFCKMTGHLQKVCMKKNSSGGRGEAHQVEENRKYEIDRETIDTEELCGVYDAADRGSKGGKFWIELPVNEKRINFEIDSGSPVSIISVDAFKQLFPCAKLCQSDLELVSYSGNAIELCGMCVVQVEHEEEKYELRLYVAKNKKHALLGRSWIRALRICFNKYYDDVNTLLEACEKSEITVDNLIKRYGCVFEKSMGKIKGLSATLQLKRNVQPVYLKARSVPFAIRDAVKEEIENLVKEGVLVKVNHSSWATPVVPVMKLNNKVRLCGDYKITINPNLVVDEHPLPTVEELFANVSGGDKFTKIDLSQAYLQLEVDPECQELLTLSTHMGLYRPTRLMYGVNSAPAIWQRLMEEVLSGIPGVTVFLDDIRITGPNDAVHLQRLEEVLIRLSKYNMRANLDKCQFFSKQIQYCGYVIDRYGIHKEQKKIDAVQNMPVPENKDQVRSFVGLVNYYGRFFPQLSTILYPLNRLLRNEVPFQWSSQCDKAFKKVKEEMQSERFLVHYNPEFPLILATDASPYGVGAVLSHVYPDGSERPIQYASQTLNETQRRYKQVDREAYAIIFGVRKFHQYLCGRKFTLMTDNEPLKQIFSETKGLPTMAALRMQHYATFLQAFNYTIKFRPTKEHCNADAFSRLPISSRKPDSTVEEVELVEVSIIETLPMTAEHLAKSTSVDSTVKILIQGLKNGKTVDPRDRFGIDQSEFTLQKGCIMRGIRVYVPPQLRKQVLDELHSTHFGITRMKTLARGYVWWQHIDKDIEELVKNCAACQITRPNPPKVSLHCWERPKQPFERVHVDFAGPFMGSYFIVFVDAFTKWPEVKIVRDITTSTTIHACRELFATFGIPCVLVSDHGVQFTASEFQSFLSNNGVFHKMGAPYHPATNGQAERFIQTFKNKMKALNCDRNKMHAELFNILLTYRKTIHPVTGKSPSMMLFGRQIRSRLDLMLPNQADEYEKPETNVRSISEGARVAARDYIDKQKWKYGNVIEKLGKLHYKVKLDDDRIWKRHIDQLREVGIHLRDPSQTSSSPPPVEAEAAVQQTIDPTATEVQIPVPAPRLLTNSSTIGEPSISGVSTTASPSLPDAPPGVADQPVLRRSSRVINPPIRLNL